MQFSLTRKLHRIPEWILAVPSTATSKREWFWTASLMSKCKRRRIIVCFKNFLSSTLIRFRHSKCRIIAKSRISSRLAISIACTHSQYNLITYPSAWVPLEFQPKVPELASSLTARLGRINSIRFQTVFLRRTEFKKIFRTRLLQIMLSTIASICLRKSHWSWRVRETRTTSLMALVAMIMKI